ncbi:di-heme oxidoredictase family protein [Granulosicoccus antarcticus]|uniref:Cytochrome c domain-containing protein n=1 Tax=Granulosicoccus antarcticus IMCC3135 TaxID=1192854 RepID=A0A2Z2NSC2_9GAMM|nr:di-heme oxidoredictase family protein [Granulosicoccus antarcticus]ASJ74392.1 hypothetical protein IMCC3135_21575 [Granulosicoccus antarcticus IMCC3135]
MKLPTTFLTACMVLSFPGSLALIQTAMADEAQTPAPSLTPWSERALLQPVLSTDYAGRLDRDKLMELISAGDHLFNARFTSLDGVGRPMATQAIVPTKRKRAPRSGFSRTAGLDANACASCHNVPVSGGAGDFSANVFVSEGFQHADFDTVDPQFSNERNTNHLFGAGLVELLAREMSRDLQAIRTQALMEARSTGKPLSVVLNSKGIHFGTLSVMPDGRVDPEGIEGVDHDLVIRPFTHKGVMTSLRQFTINALNQHHGMQAVERFGPRWTGENDHDEDGVENEIGIGDVSALVAWQASLAPPFPTQPDDIDWQAAASAGQKHFTEAGCVDCHKLYLPLESLDFADPGPLDAAGTLRTGEGSDAIYDLQLLDWASQLERDENGDVMVPLFGDLKRHVIADQQLSALGNELLSQRFVERNVFMTSELWGVASTAPYGHRGDMTTLSEVIHAHGGAARTSRDAWQAMSNRQQSELIAWLKTLAIEP